MVPQTQITEVVPGKLYAVAHQCGPTYEGPTGGLYFQGGLVHDGALQSGYQIIANGLANITHYWEVKADHELTWVGDEWQYAPAAKKAKPKAAPAPVPVKPKRRKKKAKK